MPPNCTMKQILYFVVAMKTCVFRGVYIFWRNQKYSNLSSKVYAPFNSDINLSEGISVAHDNLPHFSLQDTEAGSRHAFHHALTQMRW